MNEIERAAYIISQSVCALIEAMGMTAENHQRLHYGESMAYNYEAFYELLDQYGLHHNAVVTYLRS